MPTEWQRFRSPWKSPECYQSYIALDGAIAAVDIDRAVRWIGRRPLGEHPQGDSEIEIEIRRPGEVQWRKRIIPIRDEPFKLIDELLCLARPKKRLILIPIAYSEPDDPDPAPPPRELSRGEAAFWLEQSGYRLPRWLEPVPPIDPAELGPESRLSRSWRPLAASPSVVERAPEEKVVLSPPVRALAAAYELLRHGERVSISAACAKARVDRANLRANHPDICRMIKAMSTPAGTARYGVKDRRTGRVEAVDDPQDRIKADRRRRNKPVEDADAGEWD
jgi:hypothetical protein